MTTAGVERKVTPIPKPKIKKHKAKRNPRPTDQDCCVICGKPYASLHEVFYGKNRQKSIEWGMQVRLCERHHKEDNFSAHKDPYFNLGLKQRYQLKFEEEYGHERFMQEFGKNYLDITLEEFIKMGVA